MRYDFNDSWELTTHGKDNAIEFIEIESPTAKIVSCCSVLEQQYNKAIMNLAKNRESFEKEIGDIDPNLQQDEKDKAEQIGYLLTMGDADLEKCYGGLRECITKSKSTLNGDIRVSSSIYDEIPYKELKGLLGEYIVNFINTLG